MKILRNSIRHIILAILWTGMFSCTSQNTMEKFEWIPSASAPNNYPAEVHSGTFYYNGGNVHIPKGHVLGTKKGFGWGSSGRAHYSNDDFRPAPNAFEITWLSYRENKFYTGRFELPEKKIGELFKKGFLERRGKKATYNAIYVGMAPGGKVAVWLAGGGKKVEIGWFRAEETEVSMKAFSPQAVISLDEMVKNRVEREVAEEAKNQPIPFGLWDTYRQRYQWHPRIEFEGEEGTLTEMMMTFYNGEDFYTIGSNPELASLEERPVPNHFRAELKDDNGNSYRVKADLDEKEIFNAFEKAFGPNGEESAQLLIRIGDDHTSAAIFLRGKQEEIPLTRGELKVYPR